MSEQTGNIYQKLAKVRKQVEVIRKNKSGYGYKYVTEDEILAKISVFMDKYHLSLVPSIQSGTTRVEPYTYKKTKTTGKGEFYEENNNEILVSADMTWSWVNNDNPEERIDVSWALVGQQSDASQAFGSGLTYSSRYFLLKYFNIATPDDDPDNFRSKQRAAEAAEDILIFLCRMLLSNLFNAQKQQMRYCYAMKAAVSNGIQQMVHRNLKIRFQNAALLILASL